MAIRAASRSSFVRFAVGFEAAGFGASCLGSDGVDAGVLVGTGVATGAVPFSWAMIRVPLGPATVLISRGPSSKAVRFE